MTELITSRVTSASSTKEIVIEMKDFPRIIESIEFTVGGARFKIEIKDRFLYCSDSRIGIFLINDTNEDLTTSATLKFLTQEHNWSKKVFKAGTRDGPFLLNDNDLHSLARSYGFFSLEISITVHVDTSAPELIPIPISLKPEAVISCVNEVIMKDESTADFSLKCDTKTFRVHKSFLCARSDYFRAMITGSMREAKEGEVFIKDLDEETIHNVITFIYTGDFGISEDINVQNLALAADKCNLDGMMELLCYKLGKENNIKPRTISDMLIAALRYDVKQMKALVLAKIRADRNILDDKEFSEGMKEADFNIYSKFYKFLLDVLDPVIRFLDE